MKKVNSYVQRIYVSNVLTLILIFVASLLFIPGSSFAQSLVTTELQATNTDALDTTPTLGDDGVSSLVVYTSFPRLADGTSGPGSVYYQRLGSDALLGAPVLVSDSPNNDQLNDISGDYIVYTSFTDATRTLGQIKLFQISTGTTQAVSDWVPLREARIFGTRIAWIEGPLGATTVVTIDIIDIGLADPFVVAGPLPATANVEVGNQLIVWDERDGGQGDIRAYDPASGGYYGVATDPTVDDTQPSTFGPWVAWQSYDGIVAATAIKAVNVLTGELRIVADNDAYNRFPTMDGDFISWEGNTSGNFDIYLYRLSTAERFQLTDHSADQQLNNLFGDRVAYLDNRTGDFNIFVTTFRENYPPTADAGADQSGVVGQTLMLEGTASDPDGDPIASWQWFVESYPIGSTPVISDPNIPNPDFSADVAGEYVLSLVASDGFESSLPDLITITLSENQPPVVVLGSSGPEGFVPLAIWFNGSSSYDPEWMSLTYNWDFGDGSPISSIPNPTHFYGNPGTYTVTLTVTDELGAQSSGTLIVTAWPYCLAITPSGYDFGDVEVDSTSTQIFTFTNECVTSGVPMQSISLCSMSSPAFSITQAPLFPLTLALNETIEVEVTFAPLSAELHTGMLGYTAFPRLITAQCFGFKGNGVEAEPPADTVAEVLEFFDTSATDGTLVGDGNGNSANGRRNALRNMIEASDDLVAAGDLDGGCQQLMDAYKRTDGEPKPPDFVAGPAATDLAASLLTLMDNLSCP